MTVNDKVYQKRPIRITAVQWFKHGDHPEVKPGPIRVKQFMMNMQSLQEQEIVRVDDRIVEINPAYGWIDTMENAHEVTPGDYIIRGIKGEFYPCKPDIFEHTYDLVDSSVAEIISERKGFDLFP